MKCFSNKSVLSSHFPNCFSRILIMLLNEDDTILLFEAITLPPFTVSRMKFAMYFSFGV